MWFVPQTIVGDAAVGRHKMLKEPNGIARAEEAPRQGKRQVALRGPEDIDRRHAPRTIQFCATDWRNECWPWVDTRSVAKSCKRSATTVTMRWWISSIVANRHRLSPHAKARARNLAIFIKDAPIKGLAFALEAILRPCPSGAHVHIAAARAPQGMS